MNDPAVVMLIFGAFIAVIGGLMLRQQLRLRRKGVRVMGTVTRIEERSLPEPGRTGGAGAVSYRPVVRFHTLAGEEIETTTNVGMPAPHLAAGQQVPVIYDPGDPTLAEIDTPARRGLLTVLGLLMLPVGLALVATGAAQLIQG